MNNTMAHLLENHFQEIYNRVKAYAYHRGHPSPEDAAMNSILSALKKSDIFQGNLESLVSYIVKITHHDVIDYYRYKSKRPVPTDSIYDIEESVTPVYTDDYLKYYNIIMMLQHLDKAESDAIIARYIYDMDDYEAAKVTKRTPKYLRRARSTAYKKLRTLVAD